MPGGAPLPLRAIHARSVCLAQEGEGSRAGPNPNGAGNTDCDQGVGTGAEGCDPGNSNNTTPTNDETPGTGPGNPGKKTP